MTLRLHIRRLEARFLGLFREVRTLRGIESALGVQLRDAYQREHAAKLENERLSAQLDEAKRGLEVISEARLNADRAVEVIRGQIEAISEITGREVASLKQQIDWFSLELRGRQVFGTAPTVFRPKDEPAPTASGATTARMRSRQLTEEFMAEVERRGRMEPPPNGAEYSSTARFAENSHATAGVDAS